MMARLNSPSWISLSRPSMGIHCGMVQCVCGIEKQTKVHTKDVIDNYSRHYMQDTY